MDARSFTPSERPPVRFVEGEEAAWAATRVREAHDFWHVLFACPTTVAGELALKALEFVQTGLPAAGAAVVGAGWRLDGPGRAWLVGTALPWAVRAGSRAADLVTLEYEKALAEDLEVVRARWRITPLRTGPPAAGRRKRAA
jgi:ubiquinone biosynthesis protein COQ4